MDKVKKYCKNHKAYSRGYVNYSTWRRTIGYCIDNNDKYSIKKVFDELLKDDFFLVKRIKYRFYYKVNDREEMPTDIFTISFT